jgi:hypothetical protein
MKQNHQQLNGEGPNLAGFNDSSLNLGGVAIEILSI